MNDNFLLAILVLFTILLIFSCEENSTEPDTNNLITGTVTDIDGNIYKTVEIGNQWWMAENLKVTHYRNGDEIPNIKDYLEWSNLTTGAYCNYNNDLNNVSTYGRLYNWFSIEDSRCISMEGWHVPSESEWKTLVDYLGGEVVAGGKLKEKGLEHWNSPNTGATDEFGFCVLPSGFRHSYGFDFGMGDNGNFWCCTERDSINAINQAMGYDNSGVTSTLIRSKKFGFSIRCIKD